MKNKIIHLTTELSNSSACYRIHEALSNNGWDSEILCLRSSIHENGRVHVLQNHLFKKIKFNLWGRFDSHKLNKYNKGLPFSRGYFGLNYSDIKVFLEGFDVINIHWINYGFLSLDTLHEILMDRREKVIFTLHDSWLFTGGCHVKMGCEMYISGCNNCEQMASKIAASNINKKIQVLNNLRAITPSEWMKGEAQKGLIKFLQIDTIPNPFNLNVFKPDKNKIKDQSKKMVIGFCNSLNSYKGSWLLKEILENIPAKIRESLIIRVVGHSIDQIIPDLTVINLGKITTDEGMADFYNSIDLYCHTSFDDNYPGMVVESVACHTPVLAFNVGGLGEIVNKSNGVLVQRGNAEMFSKSLLDIFKGEYVFNFSENKINDFYSFTKKFNQLV